MPTGPVPPSAKKVQELAESFGFTMSDADADLYSEMMAGTLQSYRRLDAMQETKPPVKYPRAGSYRPGPEEDPYNAWYVKGEIKGAGGRRARRQAGRHQGCNLRRGLPHDQRRQGDGGLHPRHRRHGGDARARCRRDHPRQDQQRGLLVLRRQPHLRLRPRAQPAQADPFDRRVLQRQRRRRRGRRCRRDHRRRSGRLDPHPGELERHRRAEADLRPRALHRRHDDRDDHGPSRPHGRHGGERRPHAHRHRRRRPAGSAPAGS